MEKTSLIGKTIERSSKWRNVVFWFLLGVALAGTSLIAAGAYYVLLSQGTLWLVSVEKYWIREFGEVPGVKHYAQALLKEDMATLYILLAPCIIATIPPLSLVAAAATCIVRKKRGRLQLRIVVWSLLYLFFLFALICIFGPQ